MNSPTLKMLEYIALHLDALVRGINNLMLYLFLLRLFLEYLFHGITDLQIVAFIQPQSLGVGQQCLECGFKYGHILYITRPTWAVKFVSNSFEVAPADVDHALIVRRRIMTQDLGDWAFGGQVARHGRLYDATN